MSVTASGGSWAVAANGNIVHAVWHDKRNGNWEIYYKRSTNGGLNWETDTRLTNNAGTSFCSSISLSGMFVHVVWEDSSDGNREIYYKRSTDRGLSWGADIRLTNDPNDSYAPSLSAMGSIVHVVWQDNRNGPLFEIYYKRSTNNGANWGADIRLTNDSLESGLPSVSASGSYVHVAWEDWYDLENDEIHYKRSNNAGLSWEPEIRLTYDPAFSIVPSIYAIGQNIHVVWMDNRDGNREIYYKRSANGGINWGLDTRLTNDTAASEYPNITGCGNNVHVVWQDKRDSRYQIYYKRSADGGSNWGTDAPLTLNTGVQLYPSVGVSGTSVHVCWADERAGNSEIFYKRDPTGNISPTYTISGRVTYNDNGQPVNQGLVKALRYDRVTSHLIKVDSTTIQPEGYYTLPQVPQDTIYIMYYQNDEDVPVFVPSYYRSTIDWQQAEKIYPAQNLTDIDGQVYRINNNGSSSNLFIRGTCYSSNDLPITPLRDVIIYAKIGNDFMNYGTSDGNGVYTAAKLPPGNYTLFAYRMGFDYLTRNVTLSNNNLDTISFYFGPPIGINQLNQTIPLQISLYQNYPNPFNPATKITFDIPGLLGISGGKNNIFTELIIYDVLGKETAILVYGQLKPGTYEVIWDAGDYPTGVYFCKLKIGDYLQTKKMLLIK